MLRCRWCNRKYKEEDSKADVQGYCKQLCVSRMAKSLGHRQGNSAHETLKRHEEVGNVPAPNETPLDNMIRFLVEE